MRTLMRSGAALTATGVFLALSAQALADQAQREPRTKAVRYAELDLSEPAGAATLYRRIERAAREVCDMRQLQDPLHRLNRRAERRQCYEQAIDNAVKHVNRPQLTTVYDFERARKAGKRARRV